MIRVLSLGAIVIVAGCGVGLPAADYIDDAATTARCEKLYADAPQRVSGQAQISITDDRALAWGQKSIMMHCGVAKPAALKKTSRCDFVEGVGWLTETERGFHTFTTIGRSSYVSVVVPDSYEPAADALIDVAPAIKKHDPVVRPCV